MPLTRQLPQAEYNRWLQSPLVPGAARRELSSLDPAGVAERFGAPLRFGTAGLRAPVGAGPSWFNEYTVAWATRALGRRILARGADFAAAGVCVGYDCRRQSGLFARTAAAALRELSIPVYLFSAPRPTPELAFAVRALGAAAGICITASHNPPQYNGYKVYWQGGTQIDDALAAEIGAEMDASDPLAPLPFFVLNEVSPLGKEMDERFIASALRCVQGRGDIERCPALPIVYTPFHGVGGAVAFRALRLAGLQAVHCVPEQLEPDGDFPTTPSPNPEDPGGFGPALDLAGRVNAALILANDPDADRVAVWARDGAGKMRPLTGNQIGVLLADYLLEHTQENGAIVKTLVSTDLARRVAESRGCACFDTFTGFKFLAAEAQRLQKKGLRPVLAFEEAIGYMLNPDVLDKDGISAALVIASMACRWQAQGQTLHDRLAELSALFGFYAEKTVSVTLPGPEGQAAIKACMDSLRAQTPTVLSGRRVMRADDFLRGLSLSGGQTSALPLRGSDVLRFELENGCRLLVRPSGTEPKIKLYVLARGDAQDAALSAAEACAQDALQTLRLENYTGKRSMKIL